MTQPRKCSQCQKPIRAGTPHIHGFSNAGGYGSHCYGCGNVWAYLSPSRCTCRGRSEAEEQGIPPEETWAERSLREQKYNR